MENSSYISHHGILGMKWGQRNGPPYPLGPSDHSASEKKAGWKESLDKKSQKKLAKEVRRNTKAIKGTYYVSRGKGKKPKQVKYNTIDPKQKKVQEMDSVKKVFDDLSSAREEYRKCHKMAQDYWKQSDKERDALVERTVDWLQKDGYYKNEKREDLIRWYKYDDGDQGEYSTFAKFCQERGSSYIEESSKAWKAEQKYTATQKKAVDTLLGEYGDMPVRKASDKEVTTRVKHVVNRALTDMLYEDEWKRRYAIPLA